jgi:cell division protein FtsB
VLQQLRPYLPTAVIAIFLTYCGVQYLTGDRGFFSQETREVEMSVKELRLQHLMAERKDLEARARYLRTESLSKDLLEERARVLLGLNAPDEYVIRSQNGAPNNS